MLSPKAYSPPVRHNLQHLVILVLGGYRHAQHIYTLSLNRSQEWESASRGRLGAITHTAWQHVQAVQQAGQFLLPVTVTGTWESSPWQGSRHNGVNVKVVNPRAGRQAKPSSPGQAAGRDNHLPSKTHPHSPSLGVENNGMPPLSHPSSSGRRAAGQAEPGRHVPTVTTSHPTGSSACLPPHHLVGRQAGWEDWKNTAPPRLVQAESRQQTAGEQAVGWHLLPLLW